MKRKLCLLVVMLTVVVLAACSENQAPGQSGTSNERTDVPQNNTTSPAAEDITFPLKEKVTLKVLMPSISYIEDYATNEFTLWLEEQTNVHLDLELVNPQSQVERLNLALTSGDLPDIFLNMPISREMIMQHASLGTFLPLNDLYEQYGVHSKKMFADYPVFKDEVAAPDGNMYYMPRIGMCIHCLSFQKLYVYKPWLDKLGLDIPTTTEEFRSMLIAFRDQDPNGNGVRDEIALGGSTQNYMEPYDVIMNAFIIHNPFTDRMYVQDGKITVSYNKPEWKEGLKYLHGLWAEGLIDPESFTQDLNQFMQKTEAEPNTVGAVNSASFNWMTVSTQKGRDWITIPPLKGPSGIQQHPKRPYRAPTPDRGGLINSKTKYPEVAFKLLDYLYDREVSLRSGYGVKDRDWVEANAGQVGLMGGPATWDFVGGPHTKQQNEHWYMGASFFLSEEILGGMAASEDNPETYLTAEAMKSYFPYFQADDTIVPVLWVSPEYTAEMADMKNTINGYVKEMAARFISGDADIDSEWDTYINTLESMNLDRYIAILQEAYDQQN